MTGINKRVKQPARAVWPIVNSLLDNPRDCFPWARFILSLDPIVDRRWMPPTNTVQGVEVDWPAPEASFHLLRHMGDFMAQLDPERDGPMLPEGILLGGLLLALGYRGHVPALGIGEAASDLSDARLEAWDSDREEAAPVGWGPRATSWKAGVEAAPSSELRWYGIAIQLSNLGIFERANLRRFIRKNIIAERDLFQALNGVEGSHYESLLRSILVAASDPPSTSFELAGRIRSKYQASYGKDSGTVVPINWEAMATLNRSVSDDAMRRVDAYRMDVGRRLMEMLPPTGHDDLRAAIQNGAWLGYLDALNRHAVRARVNPPLASMPMDVVNTIMDFAGYHALYTHTYPI